MVIFTHLAIISLIFCKRLICNDINSRYAIDSTVSNGTLTVLCNSLGDGVRGNSAGEIVFT